jgi:Fic family protein
MTLSGAQNPSRSPIGHAWLRRHFGLKTLPSAVESFIVPGGRHTRIEGAQTIEEYQRSYAPGDTVTDHLRFALRHEPLDLGLMVAALKACDPRDLETWIRSQPTGTFSRRAWFLYETFTGRTLDVPDATIGNYADALDAERHVVGVRQLSQRHRVADNLLGGRKLCPMVRLTPRLKQQIGNRIDKQARELIESYDPATLARAINYLYTKETRSSFAIEGETPSANRTERFVAALKAAHLFEPTNKTALIELQGSIVDPRYAARDWRDFQNFVGGTRANYREEVHFICPRPEDVPSLMSGWMELTKRMIADWVDPVIAAAVTAFAFVFIHPFEDGNGRIHRFMVHHVLAKQRYTRLSIIFPVSASILRDRTSYDQVLESFSKPLVECLQWRWTPDYEIVVENDSADLYRYFDATAHAEYLYDRVSDTVHRDLKEELGFVAVFDQSFSAVRDIVDMPDRRASLLIQLCMQNQGRLSAAKRPKFAEITDDEIAQIEAAIQTAMRGDP